MQLLILAGLLAGRNPQFIPADAPASAFPTFGQWRYRSRLMDHVFDSCWDGIMIRELQRLGGQACLSAVSAWQVNAPLEHRHPQSPPVTSPTGKHIQTQAMSAILFLPGRHLWFLYGLLSGPARPSFNDIVPCFGLSLQPLGTKDLLHMLKVQRMHPPHVLLDLFYFTSLISPLTWNTWKRRGIAE